MRVLAVSVTPSPYQRDLFRALEERPEVDLRVAYLEKVPDDSPWADVALADWERVLPGRVYGKGRVRCHWNAPLPDVADFDAVILNVPLTAATAQRLFRRVGRARVPWAFWGEELIDRRGPRGAVRKVLAAPLGRAGAIVAIGRRAADDYRRRFPGVAVYDIPYACELSGLAAAAGRREPSSRCRFLFAGQMIERKGIDVLLGAFREQVNRGLDAELHLAGREGDLPRRLEALPRTVRERIRNLGFQQPPALPEIFAGADVFVLPSRHDGWGVVVNQALGAGMPVITTSAVGAGRDLIVDGVEGLHVAPGDERALGEAMRRLAEDPGLRQKMARAAADKAKTLTPAAAAEKWVRVLAGL